MYVPPPGKMPSHPCQPMPPPLCLPPIQCRAFPCIAGSAGDVYLSWHSNSKRVLAAGVGGKVLLVGVPAEGMEQLEFDLDDDSTPGQHCAWQLS